MPSIMSNPRSSYAESFRQIKTNIKYSSIDKDKKILLITSAEPGDGKSTIAANLAETLSQDNKKVLLMDCDLRRPIIHKFFKISGQVGLTDILIGEIDSSKAIVKVNENLHVLPSGKKPPNPAEVLGSDEFERNIREFSQNYDYIIVDTAPLGVVADSQILASKVDGTILVANYGKTKREKLLEGKELIEQVSGNLMGVIINRAKEKRSKYYYYYD